MRRTEYKKVNGKYDCIEAEVADRDHGLISDRQLNKM